MEQRSGPEWVALALAWETQLDKLSECLHQQVEDQKRFIQAVLMEQSMRSPVLSQLEKHESGLAPSSGEASGNDPRSTESNAVLKVKMIEHMSELEQSQSQHDSLCGGVLCWVEAVASAAVGHHLVSGSSWTVWLVQTTPWQAFFVLLTILNIGWVFYITDVSMQNALLTYDGQATSSTSGWVVVDGTFLLLFILELVVRTLAASASSELMHSDLLYLLVDASVVFVSALHVVFTLCGITSGFIANLRLLKTVRLYGLCHALKHVRLFAKLTRMISALAHSGEDLFWGSLLLSVISSVFSTFFLQLLTDYVTEATAHDDVVEQLRPYFSSMSSSILTSVMCVTGGVSWWEVEQHFLEVSWFLGGLLVVFVLVMFVAVLNVVTGIFVTDSVQRADADRDVAIALRTARRHELHAELISIFNDIDADKSGEMTVEELHTMWTNDKVQMLLSSVGIEAVDCEKFFHALDVDGSGRVSIDEFILGVNTIAGQSRQMDLILFQGEMKTMIHALEGKHSDLSALHVVGHKMLIEMREGQRQLQATQESILDKMAQQEVVF